MLESMPLGKPLDATTTNLSKFLAERPALWVVAGASRAAGYPTTAQLLETMRAAADDPLPDPAPFPVVADAFVQSRSQGDLAALLEREIGPPRPPTQAHVSMARLVGAGVVRHVLTTNYDDLLERALASESVHATRRREHRFW